MKRMYRNRDNTIFVFFVDKKIPSAVVFKTADEKFNVVLIKPRLFSKTIELAWKNNIYKREGGELYELLYNTMNGMTLMHPLVPSQIKVFEMFNTIFTFHQSVNKSRLYQILTVENALPANTFSELFGSIENGAAADVTVDGIHFHFPEKMRYSRRKEFINILLMVKDFYKKHGLGNVVTGEVSFSKINGATCGFYNIPTKSIKIDPATKDDNLTILYTIIHEFAHKLMYEFLPPNVVGEISRKFNDLYRIGGKPGISFTSLPIGSILKYTGKSASYRGDWVINDVKPGEITARSMETGISIRAKSALSFINSGFEPYEKNNLEFHGVLHSTLQLNHKKGYKTDAWIPTTYAGTNASEWFAETVTMYLCNALTGEPKEFIENIIKRV